MDPRIMEIIDLLLVLAKEGPAVLAFVERTYDLFKAGTLSEDQLKQMWAEAGNAAKAAEAKWQKASTIHT